MYYTKLTKNYISECLHIKSQEAAPKTVTPISYMNNPPPGPSHVTFIPADFKLPSYIPYNKNQDKETEQKKSGSSSDESSKSVPSIDKQDA